MDVADSGRIAMTLINSQRMSRHIWLTERLSVTRRLF